MEAFTRSWRDEREEREAVFSLSGLVHSQQKDQPFNPTSGAATRAILWRNQRGRLKKEEWEIIYD